ncbi:MAG: TrmH family RNA methyltransferase [Candidatus Promineifilaceae bacterium]
MSDETVWRSAAEVVRRTMTARGRASSGLYSIEGIRLHERALRAGKRVQTAVVGEAFYATQEPRIQALLYDLLLAGCELVVAPDALLAELAEGRDLGAIIGVLPIPPSPDLASFLDLHNREAPLFLVAADIKDPGNAGALVRTALASGATALIAGGICDPYHPKAVRTSMGSLFKLPIIAVEDTVAALEQLAEVGIECVGLAVDGDVLLPKAEFGDTGLAVVVGSEAFGLDDALREAVDIIVAIPMREGVDSYSVNTAAAIALYEIGRRQAAKGG